jgi:hypothetical protein
MCINSSVSFCTHGECVNSILNELDNLIHINFYLGSVQCVSLCYVLVPYSELKKEKRYFIPFETDMHSRYCSIFLYICQEGN